MSDARNLIALFWVACFGCGVLVFWLCVRSATTGVQRYQTQFSDSARRTLEQMFLFIDTKQLWTLNAVVIVAIGVLGWFVSGNLVIVAACGVIGYFLPRILFAFFKIRRVPTLRVQMPDAILPGAGGLRAGASVPGAPAQMVAQSGPPHSRDLARVLR